MEKRHTKMAIEDKDRSSGLCVCVFAGNSAVMRDAFDGLVECENGGGGEVLAPSARQGDEDEALRKRIERGMVDLIWKPTLAYRSEARPHARTIFDAVVPNYARMPVINHFPRNSSLCTKVGLFRSLSRFYTQRRIETDEVLPGTWVISSYACAAWPALKRAVASAEQGAAWICKPSALNCGRGIEVYRSLDDIKAYVEKSDGKHVVVQRYISNPLLWPHGNRKFDIRIWALVLDTGKIFVAKEGYLRTCSEPFSMDTIHDASAHLSNYCLQRKSPKLGQYEAGNTLSFADLQTMFDEDQDLQDTDVCRDLVPRFQTLILDAVRATLKDMNLPTPGVRKFELFGFDLMLDQELKPWLIEANTNPFLGVQNAWHATLLRRLGEDVTAVIGREYYGHAASDLTLLERIDQRPLHAPRGRGRVFEKWLRLGTHCRPETGVSEETRGGAARVGLKIRPRRASSSSSTSSTRSSVSVTSTPRRRESLEEKSMEEKDEGMSTSFSF
ncbi:Tubulin polyglutamylase ttll6 [Hondaea fermentalgiana]|uniref:Tubulin polyglutamylase ttll6 n=1 Tax=Hondaea fermentalgiana TaxID=2315210 RepID=A0A2R5GVQ1_9STRA|nr:Tubulin polyglutamylase ttll6 [Hondaea fermentalgiana]|eukprot:GBG31994.1 Tubulin polyglutamylase ttll6 [Hondaea fermentalgiana]